MSKSDISKWNSELKIFRDETEISYNLDEFYSFSELKKRIEEDTGVFYHDDSIMVYHYDNREITNNFEYLEDMMDLGAGNGSWVKGTISSIYYLLHNAFNFTDTTLNDFLENYLIEVFPINNFVNEEVNKHISITTKETVATDWVTCMDDGAFLMYNANLNGKINAYVFQWVEGYFHVVTKNS